MGVARIEGRVILRPPYIGASVWQIVARRRHRIDITFVSKAHDTEVFEGVTVLSRDRKSSPCDIAEVVDELLVMKG